MKGAITITSEELARMKMKANLLPNGKNSTTQPTCKRITLSINCSKAKNALTIGQTIPSILSRGNKNSGSKSLKNNSWNAVTSINNKENSSKN